MMDIEKLVQVVNYVLKKYDSRLNYTKLIKILYLADKKAIEISNLSITGDTYVSMNKGPVLSGLFDLLKGREINREYQCLWDSRFTTDSYDLVSLSDRIPEGKLSRFEKRILDEVDAEHHSKDFGQLVDYVHKNCPEWEDPGNTSTPITMAAILSAVGRDHAEIDYILEEEKSYNNEEKLLASLTEE